MAEEKNVKTGTKIEAAELATIDKAKLGEAVAAPEVEGQNLYVDYVACPWCSNVIRMQLSSSHYVGWHCGNCGNYYRA